MEEKQRVNDKCNCKSGKKYKKCCMNVPKELDISYFQEMYRNIVDSYHSQMPYANNPYCKICGDTEELNEAPLKKCNLIGGGTAFFCDTCYKCQRSM
jgi:hypothetical protein